MVKAMVFPVVKYECESWTVKKAERRRMDAFELWCWRRLLRVPWTARRSNQSIPKEISPGCSLEGLMLKLKLQYFGQLMQRTDSLEKAPDAGKDWRWEEKGMTEDEMVGWHHWFNGHEFVQALGVGDGQGSLACCSPWGYKELDTTEWLNWTDWCIHVIYILFAFLWLICLVLILWFSSVPSLSCVRLFATPWIAARQACPSLLILRLAKWT